MSRVLVIHYNKTTRTVLEAMTKRQFEVATAKNVEAAVKSFRKSTPDAIVVGHDSAKQEAGRLLKYLASKRIEIPTVVVVNRGDTRYRSEMHKLGAKAFIELPASQADFEAAIRKALLAEANGSDDDAPSEPPPMHPDELKQNLSILEKALNKNMRCVAGRNQVYIRSLISGKGKEKPRICLKCPLREKFGLTREVFYEYIRDVCCSKPGQCTAVQQFQSTRKTG